MKRLWAPALVMVTVLAWSLLPIPSRGQLATYNTASHLAYCPTRDTCLHEIGHALDQRADWVSSSPEFAEAVRLYLYVELRQPILTMLPAQTLAVSARGDGLREVYADLFQWTSGEQHKMPESLRGFYDWTLARKFVRELVDGQTVYCWQE